MKYLPELTNIVFQEIPDEVCLVYYITGCPNRCPGCHTPKAQNPDDGINLDFYYDVFEPLRRYDKVTCILFMGGDWEYSFENLLREIKEEFDIKIALYSGKESVDKYILQYLDYVKLGCYKQELGGLTKKTTNQRLFKVDNITWKMQKE